LYITFGVECQCRILLYFRFNFQYHEGGVARPMTAVRGAGYTSSVGQRQFDPLNQAAKVPASPQLETKLEDL
jgi:hypothetical protein